jgi:hypothetical protein
MLLMWFVALVVLVVLTVIMTGVTVAAWRSPTRRIEYLVVLSFAWNLTAFIWIYSLVRWRSWWFEGTYITAPYSWPF